MAEKSAPRVVKLPAMSINEAMTAIFFPYTEAIIWASPCFLTSPILAQIAWMFISKGVETITSQS